jgi:hypothetical protein
MRSERAGVWRIEEFHRGPPVKRKDECEEVDLARSTPLHANSLSERKGQGKADCVCVSLTLKANSMAYHAPVTQVMGMRLFGRTSISIPVSFQIYQ